MIKVLNVISDSNTGGAGRVLLSYLRYRDKGRMEVSAALPRSSDLCGELLALGVPFYEIDGIGERSLGLNGFINISRLIAKTKPDIVHTHASMSARLAAKLLGKKILYTRHSIFPTCPSPFLVRAVNNFTVHKVIAVSPAAIKNITDSGVPEHKISVIFNGVNKLDKPAADERSGIRHRYGLLPNDFVCGIFARLTAVKGHDYLLDAAKILASCPDIKILIAGKGELESHIKERIAAENLKNVVFAGFLAKPEELLSSIDVQLNASYGTEATSSALLEGMSAGIPAIVSDYGGNPFVIENGVNGLVVPEKNAAAIAEAILSLRELKQSGDESFAEMEGACESVFRERFCAETMARKIDELYVRMHSES